MHWIAVIAGVSIIGFTASAHADKKADQEYSDKINAWISANDAASHAAARYRMVACGVLEDPKQKKVCQLMWETVIAQRSVEKGILISWLLALELDPEFRVMVTDKYAPASRYNVIREETNRMADEIKKIFPAPKDAVAK
ncbi:hypothetical protein IVB45_02145 [Bradyrhizobium sp. 4]|uniref:hypothetical protein n=1 Tax=Bradyrhizobium sp. 4 TaxID=2782678 RepID=UPI001FFE6780|nr:hypothetical protein [Bradyrhizobium sp. 4]UPJ35835.1 hypothetical protein IVB45_02145 [Bradyrhizobium sp. 4]